MNVASIADEIFRELGEPDDITVPTISFWLTSNIGKLNNLIDAEYEIVDSEISPELEEDEKAIYKTLYFIYYYNRQVSKNLGAAAYTSVMEVKEGNRTVKRTNKNDIAKTYRGLVADYNDELQAQVLNYKMSHADPNQLLVENPILTEQGVATESANSRRFSRINDIF